MARRGRSLTRRYRSQNNRNSDIQLNKQQEPIIRSALNHGTCVFYIANFPEKLLFVDLKKGLEVCGIMEDVYISRFRNKIGKRFGFVKFTKVKDSEKLKKALNNVIFWDSRLYANYANFDRFSNNIDGEVRVKEKKRQAREVIILSRQVKNPAEEDRKRELERVKEEAIRSEELRAREECNLKKEEVLVENNFKKKEVLVENNVEEGKSEKKGLMNDEGNSHNKVVEEKVRKYLPLQEDLEWAAHCFVAKIKPELAVCYIQQAFKDAGFEDFTIIPLGGDNILLQPCVNVNPAEAFQLSAGFFNNFFIDSKPWNREEVTSCMRGAWIRCYGVPICAWNPIFFAELAESHGKLVLLDEITVNKQRMDFARMLITTSSLMEINCTTSVLIDNKLVGIRLIEEVGFGFAQDACVGFLEDDNVSLCSDHYNKMEEEPIVEALVSQLHAEWVKEASNSANSKAGHGKNPTAAQSKSVKNSRKHQLLSRKYGGENMSSEASSAAKSKRPSKRKILIPSVYGLKKIARLSEEDRHKLIRSLKKAKNRQKEKQSSKPSSKGTHCTSLSAGSQSNSTGKSSQD